MKVLLYAPYKCNTGGISRWTSHIINYYASKGDDSVNLKVFASNRSTDMATVKSEIKRIILGIKDYLILYKLFEKEIIQNDYNIVHITSSASFGLFNDLLLIKYLNRKKIKSIIHFRFGRIPELTIKNNWEWKLIKKVINRSSQVIVIDKLSYDTLISNGFKNISLLPNPVASRVCEFGKTHAIDRENRYIYFAGHGLRTKGVYELVEACRSIPNIRLKMAGTITKEVKDELLALSNNQPWLDIVGNDSYENVLTDMMKCDLFVLPTYTEGFPNVILEAMACGCAIVTTSVGAIPEMLEEDINGRYGIMVEPKNVAQLKEAIECTLDDEAFKAEIRRNVKIRVNERYNIESVWVQMNNIWKNTIITQ